MNAWAQATRDEAERACWAEDEWEAGVAECLDHVAPVLNRAGKAGGTILDLGCGVGRLLHPLADRWPEAALVGFDTSPAMLAWAQEGARPNERFLSEWHPGPLDGAYSVLVFQHLPRPEQEAYVKLLGEALKPGALFVLQFVAEGDEGPLSYPAGVEEVFAWCERASLRATSVASGAKHPTWRWLVAVR